MKISKFSKNKNKISTETTSTSMEVEITNQGNINISTEDATFGVVEKTKPEVHIVSDNPTFVVDADKNKKISVVMTPGLKGEKGEKGEDGVGGLVFTPPVITMVDNYQDLKGFSNTGGTAINVEDWVLVKNDKKIYKKLNVGWEEVSISLTSKAVSVSKGPNGGQIYAEIDGEMKLIKESEKSFWIDYKVI